MINFPFGHGLDPFLLTDGITEPSAINREKDRSKIVLYFHDLCNIMEIGEILSSFGGLYLMSSQSTMRPVHTGPWQLPWLVTAQLHPAPGQIYEVHSQ